MKKLSILLMIALLVGCLFLVACGGGPNPDNGDGGQTGGGEQTGGENNGGGEETDGYTVIVKDQFGNALSGINLQICYGDISLGNCLKPKDTDNEGKAFYSYEGTLENARVQINEAPSNAVLPEGYVFFEEGAKTLEITLKLVDLYTVYAKDENGNAFPYVNVFVYKSDESNQLVGEFEADSEGKCELALEPGNYYLVIEAKNSAFTLTNGDDNTNNHLIGDETEFTAIFKESTEPINYEVSLKDSDGNIVDNVTIKLYDADTYQVVGEAVTSDGVIKISAPNGNYFAVAQVDSDKNAQVYVFEKNNTCKGEITVYNVAAGGLKSNAIMILGQSELTVEAGKTQWLYVYNPNGETVSFVNNEGLTITGEGTYSDNTFTFKELTNNKGYIKVVNNGDSAVTYTAIIDSALVPVPYN